MMIIKSFIHFIVLENLTLFIMMFLLLFFDGIVIVIVQSLYAYFYPIDKEQYDRRDVMYSMLNIGLLSLLLEWYLCNQPLEWSETYLESFYVLLFGLFYTDVFSWCIHRMLHFNVLYKYIHCHHHRYFLPHAWVTFYCHPLENLIFNFGNVMGPILVFQTSHVLSKIWAIAALVNSVRAHSIPGSHYDHHRFLKVQYGTDVFMDRWMGTN